CSPPYWSFRSWVRPSTIWSRPASASSCPGRPSSTRSTAAEESEPTTEDETTMRKLRGLPVFLVLGLLLGASPAARPALAADNVTVQLDWVVRGDHAMFFVARDKGFFEKHGITVTAIRKGTGTPDALRLVGNGNADFGFGDLPTLAVARSQGVPDVALVAVNQRSPLAIISLKKNK